MYELAPKDNYELREKRLKLVYHVLYIFAFFWLALFKAALTEFSDVETIETNKLALYSSFITLVTIFILNILKYAYWELKCMKVNSLPSEEEIKNADINFHNALTSMGPVAFLLLLNVWLTLMCQPPLDIAVNIIIYSTLACGVVNCVAVIYEAKSGQITAISMSESLRKYLQQFFFHILPSTVLINNLFYILFCS